MKRVAVFADTHNRFTRLPEAIEKLGKVDMLFHLGDFGSDAEIIAEKLGVPSFAVRGNNDYASVLPRLRAELVEDAWILLVHGDAYYTTGQLFDEAEKHNCLAVLFGHTHEPLLTASGKVFLLNPGSLSLPRHGYAPSFAVLEVEGKDINAKIITL
jgi:hypothetical protein